MSEDKKSPKKAINPDTYIGLGIIFGVVVGVLTDNVGLWIALGLALGAGMSQQAKKKAEQVNDAASTDQGEK
jgi:hypothetical protein